MSQTRRLNCGQIELKISALALSATLALGIAGCASRVNFTSTRGAHLPAPSEITLPKNLTQMIVHRGSEMTIAPFAADIPSDGTATAYVLTTPSAVKKIPHFVRVRKSYGGIYPYVVVNAREEFIVIDQEKDILVLGLIAPERTILTDSPTIESIDYDEASGAVKVIAKTNDAPVFIPGRVNPALELPSGAPSDLLRKVDFAPYEGGQREPHWEVNQRKAFEVTARFEVTNYPGRFRVFQIDLK